MEEERLQMEEERFKKTMELFFHMQDLLSVIFKKRS